MGSLVEASKVCSKSTCSMAGKPQPLENFYRHANSVDGYRPDCKKCHNSYRADWARERYVPVTGRRYDISREAKLERERLRKARDERRAARAQRLSAAG